MAFVSISVLIPTAFCNISNWRITPTRRMADSGTDTFEPSTFPWRISVVETGVGVCLGFVSSKLVPLSFLRLAVSPRLTRLNLSQRTRSLRHLTIACDIDRLACGYLNR